jgi:subtilisin family serine protease
MKKLTLILTVVLNMSAAVQAQQVFYYYKGEKFLIQTDYSRVSIVSSQRLAVESLKKLDMPPFKVLNESKIFTKNNVKTTKMDIEDSFYTELQLEDIIEEATCRDIVKRLQGMEISIKVMPAYRVETQRLGITNNFYVKLKDESDKDRLFAMAEKNSLKVLGQNPFMPLWFTLTCPKVSKISSIEAANFFYESGLYAAAEPEFLYYDMLASNDTYYPYQWNLKNTGQYCSSSGSDINVEDAWSLTTGSPEIKVAVYDHGIEMDHPDLQANVFGTGYDANTGTSPSQVRGSHGTNCAGIISAVQNNSLGISGVSPNSKLISVSMSLIIGGDTPQQIANGFYWAVDNGSHIISCSWGGYAPSILIEDAIEYALYGGRSGVGTIVVFAAGNENNTNIRYPGNVFTEILVVGAISPDGVRKTPLTCDGMDNWGSCYGTQLDVVAPGVLIPTTTLNANYASNFGGTSAACPHVAGVAALILSRNPYLSRLQVVNIIERTAQKVGGYNYQTTAGRTNGSWNQEMGYGLIDAYTAVQEACIEPTRYVLYDLYVHHTITTCSNVYMQHDVIHSGGKLTINAEGSTT